jgi:flagellar motor component MotA
MNINIVGVIIAFLLMIGSLFMGSTWLTFIDLPGLIMVLGITWGLMLFKYGKRAFNFWWLDVEERHRIATWSGRLCLHVGVFSTVVGWIQVATELRNYEMLGPALGVNALGMFYAYLCYLFLFRPFTKDTELVPRQQFESQFE